MGPKLQLSLKDMAARVKDLEIVVAGEREEDGDYDFQLVVQIKPQLFGLSNYW